MDVVVIASSRDVVEELEKAKSRGRGGDSEEMRYVRFWNIFFGIHACFDVIEPLTLWCFGWCQSNTVGASARRANRIFVRT